MKKLILFIVLILGFINENKAQFAASSEIYYYLCVSNTGGAANSSEIVKFYNNGVRHYTIFESQYNEKSINKAISEFEKKDWTYKSYDSDDSTSSYVAYSKTYEDGSSTWLFFSKDKSEMIKVQFLKYTYVAPLTVKRYYKRVTKQDLINKDKPNFDFLE